MNIEKVRGQLKAFAATPYTSRLGNVEDAIRVKSSLGRRRVQALARPAWLSEHDRYVHFADAYLSSLQHYYHGEVAEGVVRGKLENAQRSAKRYRRTLRCDLFKRGLR